MHDYGEHFVHNPAKLASPAQKACLVQLGLAVTDRLNSAEANQLIRAHHDRWARLPATPAQEGFLRRKGLWRPGMGRGAASELIGRLKAGPASQ